MRLLIAAALCLPALGFAQHDHGGHHPGLAAGAAEHGESLYHLDAVWTDHRGETLRLGELAGQPVIVVMFYGSCTTACPILLHDAARLEALLPAPVRERTRILAVSFDSGRDTVAALAEYARSRELDGARWSFLHGGRAQVRELATLLGVRFRANQDGSFDHSNLVTVLDGDGRIVHRVEGLAQPMEVAAAAVAAVSGQRSQRRLGVGDAGDPGHRRQRQ